MFLEISYYIRVGLDRVSYSMSYLTANQNLGRISLSGYVYFYVDQNLVFLLAY